MKKFVPQPGFTVSAHRLALDPGAAAVARLHSHAGAARAAYNWAVAHVTAGWWEENSKEAYNTGLGNASAAFDNYAKSRNGKRRGARVGVPRFKSKRKARAACRFTTGAIRIEADGRHLTLPRIGTIRLHEPRPDLRARIDAGHLRILSATVRLDRGRWFVSFQVEQRNELVRVARPDAGVGIDLGIKTLAVLADSDGAVTGVPNPRHLDRAQKQLRRAGRVVSRRRGPDRRTGQKPSRRWEKANRARNKVHHRVANLREDSLHKLTTRLTAEYGTLVVEDLNVAGMGRNRRLSRRVADAAFGEIRRQLTYKPRRHGTRLVVADRWLPSSKTCSRCGAVKAKLPLHVRVFECDACGLVLDRDENAGHNLLALANRTTRTTRSTGTGVAGDLDPTVVVGSKPRGADRKTRTTLPQALNFVRAGETPSGHPAGTGRAGGTIPGPRAGTETGDRQQDTRTQLALW
ncbi:IS607 family element RNA-guided endonuclease TnpB [Streptomyces sp. NPDC019224]|uniref:IS607 family element RNA-guided endonuclease TnpB n=1 Tax=Streptomyces sp. NPDC019224 TaxID=3154484 RepID=UPI0033C78E31